MKRFLVVLAVPVFLALGGQANAQTGAQCAAIDDDGARLVCYDEVFRTASSLPDASAVVFESEQLIPARPSGRAPATITVSCQPNGLQIAFGFAGNTLSSLGNDVGMTLQYDLTRRSSTLPVNADNTAVLIDNSRDALTFIDNLAGVTNLTVRVTPTSARTLSVRFRVDAFAQNVVPVVAACS
ncbi:hypothetical protein [Devosia faecipullorum]|uniref:hypothetical protein n=1 Tax=Devosia faecipullorum TaxID=2755039 RepID=UPI00187B83F9|nr:hypothetical protein [Devosia faecipullorum]MBE7733796.1 hypothetical protein [Devosia faecipullorum]